MHQPVLSIRNVVAGLGVFSVVIALALASFGLFAIHLQGTGLDQVILLQTTLRNHQGVKSAVDGLRTDVLRSLGEKAGWNGESTAAIGGDVWSHAAAVRHGMRANLELGLPRDLHDRYVAIGDLAKRFSAVAVEDVRLAASDPGAAQRSYDAFRTAFVPLEDALNETHDVLAFRLFEAEENGAAVAALSRQVIEGAVLAGVLVLLLTTWIAMRIVRRITVDLATSRAEAHRLSLHDTLTGLPNRVMFAKRINQALDQVRHSRSVMAMLCIDLDRFKEVNDTLGHAAGDVLLRSVAERLRANVRDGDMVARLGGDEFAVIQVPIASAEEASAMAGRLVAALSQPYDLEGHQVAIGASIGVALAPHAATDGADLLKMADVAMYQAKSDGRGTVRFFEAGMDDNLQARLKLEADLRAALIGRQFEVHYQPLVELASGGVTGFEALVRWRHPDRGLVPPGDFIPLAEETGLIGPLGAWVLQQACADAMTWPSHISVAVNVSAVQFRRDNLIDAVRAALTASGLEPGRLEIEITETALLVDGESTLATLRQLQAIGVQIAMDDFGTGYSSLSYLRSFPFNKIKIDQSFIRDIETSSDCKSIIRAVTGLGLSLGIATTAEGVETLSQIEHLRAEGCDMVQGYYFSRPVPASEVSGLLRKHPGRRTRPATKADEFEPMEAMSA